MSKVKVSVLAAIAAAVLIALFLALTRVNRDVDKATSESVVPANASARSEAVISAQSALHPTEVDSPQAQTRLPEISRTQLQLLMDDALSPTTTPEGRALVMHLSDMCLNASMTPAMTTKEVRELNEIDEAQAGAVVKEVQQAQRQLTAFCATGNVTEMVDRLKRAKLSMFGPIEKSLVKWTGGQRSQEYFQAATQVLANPNAYAVQFDTWLSKDLDTQLAEKYGLSSNQSIHVRDALYNKFVTTNNNHALRLIERCALRASCPSSTRLNDTQTAQSQQVADQIEQAIEQQRWSLLVPTQ